MLSNSSTAVFNLMLLLDALLSCFAIDLVLQGPVTADELLLKLARLGYALEQAGAAGGAGTDSPAQVVAAAAHILDGLHALALATRGDETLQRALSPAYSAVAGLLIAPAVLRDVSLVEKSVRAVRVLALHSKEASDSMIAADAGEGMWNQVGCIHRSLKHRSMIINRQDLMTERLVARSRILLM